MDPNNSGSGVAYAETLKKTHAGVKDVKQIITGHSTVMTPDDLADFAAFVGDFVDAARAAKKSGQTVDQLAGSWKVPEKYSGYAAPQPNRLRANLELIFKELP
jgi:hypothetical protein